MTYEQKIKLKDLRCKAWGITEDEYYCKWCGDFDLDDMYKAYRRGKNKNLNKVKELRKIVTQFEKDSYCGVCHFKTKTQLKQAIEIIRQFIEWADWEGRNCPKFDDIKAKAEAFLKE